MPDQTHHSRRSFVAALALTVAVPFCASTSVAQEVSANLPASIVESKTIRVGIETTYPPMAYMDPATSKLTGFNVEYVERLAELLGLKVEWFQLSFEQLTPSLETDRIDMIGTAISDLPSRRETMTFVDYLASGAQPFTLASNGETLKTNQDLCGVAVGAPRNSSYLPTLKAWSEKNCEAKSLAPINATGTEGATDSRLALSQGRVKAAVLGAENVAYLISQNVGTYVRVGDMLNQTLFGFGFKKDREDLRTAIFDAITKTIQDGSYAKTIDKYGLASQALEKPLIDSGKPPY